MYILSYFLLVIPPLTIFSVNFALPFTPFDFPCYFCSSLLLFYAHHFSYSLYLQFLLDVGKRKIGIVSSKHCSTAFLWTLERSIFARKVLDYWGFLLLFWDIFSFICNCVVSIKSLCFSLHFNINHLCLYTNHLFQLCFETVT